MNTISEQLESLIVRSLDGELTDDEQLALDRELIRNPDARRLLDEYRAVDGASCTAMNAWLDATSSPAVLADAPRLNDATGRLPGAGRTQFQSRDRNVFPSRDPEGAGPLSRRAAYSPRFHQWAIFVPGAIAAALLAIIIPKPVISPHEGLTGSSIPSVSPMNVSPWDQPHVSPAAMRNVSNASWAMPATQRDTGHEWIGIVGDDGNLYWIEVQRTRTIERGPNPFAPASRLNEM